MKYEKKNLFSTPIWEFFIEDNRMLNKKILLDGQQYTSGNWDFLDLPGEGIADLKQIVLSSLQKIIDENNWPVKNTIIRCRQNPIKPLEYDSPHLHPAVDMLGVYYVMSKENSGDILFQDPRAVNSQLWMDQNVQREMSGRSARVSYKVKPVPGTLIFFPSYLIHSVEPNRSDEVRMSIIFEFKFEYYDID